MDQVRLHFVDHLTFGINARFCIFFTFLKRLLQLLDKVHLEQNIVLKLRLIVYKFFLINANFFIAVAIICIEINVRITQVWVCVRLFYLWCTLSNLVFGDSYKFIWIVVVKRAEFIQYRLRSFNRCILFISWPTSILCNKSRWVNIFDPLCCRIFQLFLQ